MIREAVLFIPAGEHRVWVDVLGQYAVERGYTIVAVVADFAEAVATWQERPGRKLIVARIDMTQDLEIVTVNPSNVSASQRRPQRLTQSGAPSGRMRPQLSAAAAAEVRRPQLGAVS